MVSVEAKRVKGPGDDGMDRNAWDRGKEGNDRVWVIM